MLYLRARYYNPADGRFQSRDTWGGNNKQPISYNKWIYTFSNPIKYIDPLGRYPSQYANFESGDGVGEFAETDEVLIHVALETIASAYLRSYNDALLSLQAACGETRYLTSLYKLDKTQIFYRIHGGKITFKKFDKNPGYFGEASTKNVIYLYKCINRSKSHSKTG